MSGVPCPDEGRCGSPTHVTPTRLEYCTRVAKQRAAGPSAVGARPSGLRAPAAPALQVLDDWQPRDAEEEDELNGGDGGFDDAATGGTERSIGVFFHVTPIERLESVLSHGLLIDPERKNFATGRKVYLASSQEDARRWASEVALQRGSAGTYALLEVNAYGLGARGVPPSAVEIGVGQTVVEQSIPAGRVSLVDVFEAEPQDTHLRHITAMGNGDWGCGECGTVYRSRERAEEHAAEWDEDNSEY